MKSDRFPLRFFLKWLIFRSVQSFEVTNIEVANFRSYPYFEVSHILKWPVFDLMSFEVINFRCYSFFGVTHIWSDPYSKWSLLQSDSYFEVINLGVTNFRSWPYFEGAHFSKWFLSSTVPEVVNFGFKYLRNGQFRRY